MKTFIEILAFRKLVSPAILHILFWAAVAGCFYGAYVLYRLENWVWIMPLVFGPLLTRVIFERAMIAFLTLDRLDELVELTKAPR